MNRGRFQHILALHLSPCACLSTLIFAIVVCVFVVIRRCCATPQYRHRRSNRVVRGAPKRGTVSQKSLLCEMASMFIVAPRSLSIAILPRMNKHSATLAPSFLQNKSCQSLTKFSLEGGPAPCSGGSTESGGSAGSVECSCGGGRSSEGCKCNNAPSRHRINPCPDNVQQM